MPAVKQTSGAVASRSRRRAAAAAEENRSLSLDDVHQAVIDGALLRVRPIIMTVAATIGGLLPIMLGGGTG